MSRYTIRFEPDGDGWWYSVRDPRGQVLAQAWRAGDKKYAREEARRIRDNARRSKEAA